MTSLYRVRVLVEAEDPLKLRRVLEELYASIEGIEKIGGAAIWYVGDVLVKVIIPRIERSQPLSPMSIPRGIIVEFSSTNPGELVRIVGDIVRFFRERHVLVSLLE